MFRTALFRTTTLYLSTALITFLTTLGAISASAQTANGDDSFLAAAAIYDEGTLDVNHGGLDPQFWQGTSSDRATSLIAAIDANINGQMGHSAYSLIRPVLLSSGVPPQFSSQSEYKNYTATRLNTLLAVNEISAFQSISSRANLNAADPHYVKLFTEHALLTGQTAHACQLADGVTTDRKSPYWAKLRAYCHFTRDELPAAELTADLVKRADHKDSAFFALLGNLTGSGLKPPKPADVKTPLHIDMAKFIFKDGKTKMTSLPPALASGLAQNVELNVDLRLKALQRGAHVLNSEHISQILNSFAMPLPEDDSEHAESEHVDIDINALLITKDAWSAVEWGQAYTALRSSTDMTAIAKLCTALLSQSETAGMLMPMSRLLETDIATIPHNLRAAENASLFARLAVQNRDINGLQALFQNLDADTPVRGRIALASDALGNGFMLTELGVDIETRLASKNDGHARAVRDTYIAVSLGAKLSDTALKALLDTQKLNGYAASPAEILALKDAGQRRTQAETLLRAATIIGTYHVSELRVDTLTSILTALNATSLHAQAGQLAALDFLHGY